MTSIIFMFLANSVSIWNPTENFISEYWQWQTWQCHTLSALHTPAHSIFFLSLDLNICLMDVCDDLFGLWGGLWLFVVWFVVFCGVLWCLVPHFSCVFVTVMVVDEDLYWLEHENKRIRYILDRFIISTQKQPKFTCQFLQFGKTDFYFYLNEI